MSRPKGSRNSEYTEKRAELADAVFGCLLDDPSTSLMAMAEAAGVSRPTLRHYFDDRDGAVRAALEAGAARGEPHYRYLRSLPVDDAGTALATALRYLVDGWRRYGVGNLHSVGLAVGLQDRDAAATYRTLLLDPLQESFQVLLDRLVAAGRLAPHDTSVGAIQLLGPVTTALLHQDALGGAVDRPLDLDGLIVTLTDDFLAAHDAP